MAITTINENDYIKDSRAVINDNFTELNTAKAPLNSPALTGTPTAPTPNPGDDSTKLATTEYVQEEIRTHANLPVGFEYFSPNPNIPQGSLPLFGGEYSRDTYSTLWEWVQDQTGYCITESEWQDLSTAQNGNVPYYSDGDGSTTFRVPSLKCWVKAANGTVTEVGSYLEAGLPNITGVINSSVSVANTSASQGDELGVGAFSAIVTQYPWTRTSGSNNSVTVRINASKSNAIYGNATTVQPESIVGMWLVKAYGTIVDTGTIDEQQYIDDRIAALPNTFLPLAGGEMNGDIYLKAGVKSTDWQTDYQYPTIAASRWGVRGTLPVDRNIVLPMVAARDASVKSFEDETCRYSLLETQLYPDGRTRTVLRAYKNYDEGTDNATLEINYNSDDTRTLLFNNKNVERVNASSLTATQRYIRFESGLQICWGSVSLPADMSTVSITYGAAFTAVPGLATSLVRGTSYRAFSPASTGFKAALTATASDATAMYYVATGRWK